MAPRTGQRSILQYMVPWLSNIELMEESHPPPAQPDYTMEEEDDRNTVGQGLRGSGWGSPEGTKVVLHNLLYITAKVIGCPPPPPKCHVYTRVYREKCP